MGYFAKNRRINIPRIGINTTPSSTFDVNGITTTDTLTSILIEVGDITLTNDTIECLGSSGLVLSGYNDIILDPNDSIVRIPSTSALKIPLGTEAERPSSEEQAFVRFNTDTNSPEIYDGTNWVGFTPQFVDMNTETFTGDGSTTVFVVSTDGAVSEDSLLIDINGIVQCPGVSNAYTFDSGTNTVTFTEAPYDGRTITIRQLTNVTDIRGLGNAEGTIRVVIEGNEIKFIHSSMEQLVFDGNEAIISTTLRPDNSTSTVYDLGTSGSPFNTLYVDYINGSPADIAEQFDSDEPYEPGTVVVMGENDLLTQCEKKADTMVIGIVSTDPAYTLNYHNDNSIAVGLVGTVPCKVVGPINTGDLLISSAIPGHACVSKSYIPGTIIAKAMESITDTGIIKVLIWNA